MKSDQIKMIKTSEILSISKDIDLSEAFRLVRSGVAEWVRKNKAMTPKIMNKGEV